MKKIYVGYLSDRERLELDLAHDPGALGVYGDECDDDALEVSLEHPGVLSNLPHDEPEEFNEPDEDYYRDYVE